MGSKTKGSPEGARIRRLRLEAQLTQEQLARTVGLTTHTVWRLENDPAFNPRVQTLRAIAKALGVDVCYLLSGGSQTAQHLAKRGRAAGKTSVV